MSYISLGGKNSERSQNRANPASAGFEWVQIDSFRLVIERWVWSGSVYISDLKLHSIPIDDFNYISGGKFWTIGINPAYGLYLASMKWNPILTPGTYNQSNYWALAISEFRADNNSPVYSTEIPTGVLSPTINTNILLNRALDRTVSNGAIKLRLTTYKSGNPPPISHGWIGVEYRLLTP